MNQHPSATDNKTTAAPVLKKAITKDDLQARLEDMAQRVMNPREGIYGPRSMAWKVNRHTDVMFGAGCANLLQLAHPWVTQAIDQHSKTQTDPFGRLRRTFLNVHSMVFGSLDQVLDASLRVHNIHATITGKASESTGSTRKGSEYFANQIGAMLWVHATLWITGLQMHELFHGALSKAERDQYYAESKLFAYLFGIPDSAIPDTWEDFMAYFQRVVDSDELAVGDVGRQLVEYIFSMKPYLVPLLNRHKIHTAILLPERLRAEFHLPEKSARNQAKFDFDVKLIRNVMRYAPDHVKYLPPYLEAQQRLEGHKAGAITRMTNRIIYGQPLLVS